MPHEAGRRENGGNWIGKGQQRTQGLEGHSTGFRLCLRAVASHWGALNRQ